MKNFSKKGNTLTHNKFEILNNLDEDMFDGEDDWFEQNNNDSPDDMNNFQPLDIN